MIRLLVLAAALFAGAVHAAGPSQMQVVYDLYRNGIKLGQVTDTFTRSGTHYTLTSETRATGLLKMLWPGNIHLESIGLVTPQGLRPLQFQHARSDAPDKLATARLDWNRRSVAYHYRGESWKVDGLQDGAQDQLSELYQFMFVSSLPIDYTVQVIGGRDHHRNDFHYVQSDGGTLQTPVGAIATLRYERITQKPDEKAISVWVAPGRNNLPVQVRVAEGGVTVEQRLLRVSVGD